MSILPTVPPIPGQKLLAAPKEMIVQGGKDFFDFTKRHQNNNYLKLGGLLITVLAIGALAYFYTPLTAKLAEGRKDLVHGYVPVSSEPKSISMEIQNPDNELLVFEKTVVVTGTTSPKSAVVIINGNDFVGTEADKTGKFQKVVDLQAGVNLIQIQAFDAEGNSKSDSRTVFYSEEKL